MSLKNKILSSNNKLKAGSLDIKFPLESFTIQEVIDYVLEHCVVNAKQFNFFRTGSKDSPVYRDPATYFFNSDLGLYRGMGSMPLDRKEKGWYITYNGEFLLGVLSRRYTGDRLIKNEKKHGWDLSRPTSTGGNFYIGYYDGYINYYVRRFTIPSQDKLKSNAPVYQIRISGYDFLEMNQREIVDKYYQGKLLKGFIEYWKKTSFIDTMFHFKLDPNLFASNQLLNFINWPLEKPQGLI